MSKRLIAQETTELDRMNDKQLLAYHNILTANQKMVCTDRARNDRHLKIVKALLGQRGLIQAEA